MFRSIRLPRRLVPLNARFHRRTFLSLSRLPMKLESRRQAGEFIDVQKVRFRSSMKAKVKKFAITVSVTYFCMQIYIALVLYPLARALAETAETLPKDELERKPLFIPFPGTTKQLKPVAYRGNDPEWQAFVKFSKDTQMAQIVRDELAALITQVASSHPILAARFGKEMKLRRYWLDVDFPQHAPPEFDVKGIEFGDSITIARRHIDASTVGSIRNVLWPKAVAVSFGSLAKLLVVDEWRRLGSVFGLGSTPPPPALDQLLAQHQKIPKGPPSMPQLPTNDTPPQPSTVTAPPKALDAEPADKHGILEIDPAVGNAIHAYFLKPITAFKNKLLQTWRSAPCFPARGSILVSGMVEIDAPKAWLVFDVKAAWDPKTKEYDPRSMVVQLRRMQHKKQNPQS